WNQGCGTWDVQPGIKSMASRPLEPHPADCGPLLTKTAREKHTGLTKFPCQRDTLAAKAPTSEACHRSPRRPAASKYKLGRSSPLRNGLNVMVRRTHVPFTNASR